MLNTEFFKDEATFEKELNEYLMYMYVIGHKDAMKSLRNSIMTSLNNIDVSDVESLEEPKAMISAEDFVNLLNSAIESDEFQMTQFSKVHNLLREWHEEKAINATKEKD